MSSKAEPERVPWREVYVVVLLLLVRLYDACIEHFATLIDNMHFVDFVKSLRDGKFVTGLVSTWYGCRP